MIICVVRRIAVKNAPVRALHACTRQRPALTAGVAGFPMKRTAAGAGGRAGSPLSVGAALCSVPSSLRCSTALYHAMLCCACCAVLCRGAEAAPDWLQHLHERSHSAAASRGAGCQRGHRRGCGSAFMRHIFTFHETHIHKTENIHRIPAICCWPLGL